MVDSKEGVGRKSGLLISTIYQFMFENIYLLKIVVKKGLSPSSVVLGGHNSLKDGSVVKNPHANAGDAGHLGSIPGWGRSPRGENGYLLQFSCLKNPMDRGAWQATVRRDCKELDMIERLSTHTQTTLNKSIWGR